MGTGGALRHARDFLADSFLLIYGDSYLPIDYPEMLRSLGARDVIGLMAVYHDKTGELKVRGNCAVDKAGFVTAYHKTGTAPLELRYVEAGVMAFRRGVIDLIPPSGPASLEHEVFPILIARRQLVAAITSQRFYDIGTPDRLKAIERILA
jgi:NDP-sugar pyrophosphorylase family protein